MVSLRVKGTVLVLQLEIGQLELRADDETDAMTWAEALKMPLPVAGSSTGDDQDSDPGGGGLGESAVQEKPIWGDIGGQPLNTKAWKLEQQELLGDAGAAEGQATGNTTEAYHEELEVSGRGAFATIAIDIEDVRAELGRPRQHSRIGSNEIRLMRQELNKQEKQLAQRAAQLEKEAAQLRGDKAAMASRLSSTMDTAELSFKDAQLVRKEQVLAKQEADIERESARLREEREVFSQLVAAREAEEEAGGTGGGGGALALDERTVAAL